MKTLLIPFCLAIVCTMAGCVKPSGGRCEESIDAAKTSEVVVTFKDKATGRYLYSEVNPAYNKDSLRVYDPAGKSLVILSQLDLIPNTAASRFYVLSFGPIYDAQTDASSFGGEVCKTYLVRYNATESDTVRTCFRLRKTECGSVFDPIKVYHKGELLTATTGESGVQVTLLKN